MGDAVFVSYARVDFKFVKHLCEALVRRGHQVWLDTERIAGADWLSELERGIETSAVLVFVISPQSLDSEICRHELEHALRLGKRVVPLLRREVDVRAVPVDLKQRPWIEMRETDDAAIALEDILGAIDEAARPRAVGERGFEPLKAEPTGLQPVPFGHSGTPPDRRAL